MGKTGNNQDILITGATGTIGQALLDLLIIEGYGQRLALTVNNTNTFPYEKYNNSPLSNNSILYTDLTKKHHIESIFEHWPNIKTIIHLAANANPRSGNIDEFYDLNLKSTHHLLEFCPKNIDFIYASSILVYGESGGFCESDQTKPNSVYGITKLACENLLDVYHRKGKVRPRILRFCGNLSRNLRHGRAKEAFDGTELFKLMGKAPGNACPYCHVDDTARAILAAINYNKPKLTANICPEDYLSLEEVLKTINSNVVLEWDGIGDSTSINCYNDTAWIQLNWRPTYTSKQVLQKIIEERRII